ncbi:DUF1289 domain-containing protein [uncultured Limnohabitans sp.]|jgi:uncharacterized protein|uniref:DUF1289 domain-containing protein n=1 Tax=uncultured Limnohabitans sp. TaxID=768543 RepID=UPI002634F6F4|nr:DUF1289 domain-containing protein [uncultured Limnohabitans sp.]
MNLRAQVLAQRAADVLAEALPHVPSPCMSVCVMHPQAAVCEGCLRSLEEIGAWSRMPDEAKRQVWQRIQQQLSEVPGH